MNDLQIYKDVKRWLNSNKIQHVSYSGGTGFIADLRTEADTVKKFLIRFEPPDVKTGRVYMVITTYPTNGLFIKFLAVAPEQIIDKLLKYKQL